MIGRSVVGYVLCAAVIGAALAGAASPAGAVAPADSLALARAWIARSEAARAEPVARRALARLEARPGAAVDSLADALDVLVEALWRQGYATRPDVRALAERALALRDTSAGAPDARAAQALLDLGAIRAQTADPGGSRGLLDRALALRSRDPGRDSLEFAWVLNERAALALRTGDLDAARDGMRRVLSIRERARPRDDALVAWSCSNLASVLEARGELVGARRLRERCARLRERALPPGHPDRARGLKDLANTLVALGEYGRARQLYDAALHMRVRALGADHPDVANSLANLADLDLRLGDLAAARRAAERALAIRERTYDPANPEIATSLLQVARVRAESGERRAAIDTLRRALAIRERAFGADAPVTALALDALAGAWVADGRPDSALALAARAVRAKSAGLGAGHPDVALSWALEAEALAAAGRTEAAIAAALEGERIAREHLETTLAGLTQAQALAYDATRASGLDLAVRLAPRRDVSAHVRADVWDALVRARGSVLDAVAAHLRGAPAAVSGLADVRAHLPAGAALVAFARCEGGRFPVRRPAAFVAFVLAPGADSVRTIALGPAAAIEGAVAHWRERVLARAEDAGGRAALARAGAALRRAAWDPLQAALGPVRRVLVVPDGALLDVDFYALPAARGGYLLEQDRLLERLDAERRLCRPAAPAAPGGRLLALGGIDYAGAALAPLPRSRHEVEAVAALWARTASGRGAGPARVLAGSEATAAALQGALAGCEVLHVATHGVFAGEGIDPLRDLRRGAGAAGETHSVFERSGLVLAPAGSGGAGGGLLSVADVARLDLSLTRWVVLSGCETGAGRPLAREGALGLRSAFALAGARVVIASLWPVEDRRAEAWMLQLYRGRYAAGLGTGAAVREASRQLLASRRRLGLDDGPATWAGFVASGIDD